MKRFLAFCLVITLILVSVSSVFAEEEIKVTLNGNLISFDVPPQIITGRTMVPIRAIFETMGAIIYWHEGTQIATCVRENVTVVMKVGSRTFWVNGEAKTMDVAPTVINNRTLAPARYVAESFGYDVTWDPNSQTVKIADAIPQEIMNYFSADKLGNTYDFLFGLEDIYGIDYLTGKGEANIKIVNAKGIEVFNKTYKVTPDMFTDDGVKNICRISVPLSEITTKLEAGDKAVTTGTAYLNYHPATGYFMLSTAVTDLPYEIEKTEQMDYFDSPKSLANVTSFDICFGVSDSTQYYLTEKGKVNIRIEGKVYENDVTGTEVFNKTYSITPSMFIKDRNRTVCRITIPVSEIAPTKVGSNHLSAGIAEGTLHFSYQTSTETFERSVNLIDLPYKIDYTDGFELPEFESGEFTGTYRNGSNLTNLYLDRMEVVDRELASEFYTIAFEGRLRGGNIFFFYLVYLDEEGFEIGSRFLEINTSSKNDGSFKIRKEVQIPKKTARIEFRWQV